MVQIEGGEEKELENGTVTIALEPKDEVKGQQKENP